MKKNLLKTTVFLLASLFTYNSYACINTNAEAGASSTICKGKTANLTASGGISFQWSNGSTEAAITVSPTVNTTYTVTVTDGSGCTGTDITSVIVRPLPIPNDGNTQSICKGKRATLSVTGGNSYNWSNGATTYSIAVSPTTTTTYTVTANNAYGCTMTSSAVVTVNSLPVADAGSSATICNGKSTTLIGSGGTIYNWSNGETNANNTVSPSVNTTYTLTVTDENSCSQTDVVSVIVRPTPIADAGNTQTICFANPARLTVTGGTTYNWNNGATNYTISVSPATTTTYTVTANNSYGCTMTSSAVVTVDIADAGPSQTICKGENVNLTATGGSVFNWSEGSTTSTINVSPSTNTTYTVTVSDAFGCTSTDRTSVIISPIPIPDANNDQTVCKGTKATLSIIGGTSYNWSNGATTYSIAVSPATTSTYNTTVTNAYSCTVTFSAVVTIIQPPVADANNTQTMCYGGRARLRVWEGTTYNWSNGVTNYYNTVSPKVTTTYTCTASNASGCSMSTSMVVTVKALPTAEAGNSPTICKGQSTNITATGGISYIWNTGSTNSTINVSPNTHTTYTVTVTDAFSCSNTDRVSVIVKVSPIPSSGNTQTICKGGTAILQVTNGNSYNWNNGSTNYSIAVSPNVTSTYTVTAISSDACTITSAAIVTVNSLPNVEAGNSQTICKEQFANLNATGGISYNWSNGNSGSSINVSPATYTIYTVTATDINGCTNTDIVSVFVNPVPIEISSNSQTISSGGTARFTITGGTTYNWNNGETTYSIAVSPTISSTYTCTATTAYGCSKTFTDFVVVGSGSPINQNYTMGIDNNTYNSNYSIYPNPSNGVFNIDLNFKENEINAIEIRNMVGQIIFKETNISNNISNKIDISKYSSGLYYLVIYNKTNHFSTKLTKY